MKTLNLKSKDIVSAMRFDGSYHISEGTIFLKKLKRMPHADLISFCPNIFTAGRNKRVYTDKEKGFPYLSNSDVVKNNPFESCNYNSKKYGFDKTAFLKEGMILTGRVGAIGQTSYVTKEFEENQAMGSDNIIRIVAKDKKMSGYIYAFLVSKYGNALFNRLAAGGVQPYISEAMLQDIPIPILPEETQQKIHNLIVESAQLRVEANKLLREAKEKILKELALDKPKLTHSVNVSDLTNSHLKRFEAFYFNSNGSDYRSQIEKRKHIKLKDLSERIFRPGIFKRNYVQDGVEFLGGSDITNAIPASEKKLAKARTSNFDELVLEEDWILVTCGGTIGTTVLVNQYLSKKLASQHILRVVAKDIPVGYLFAFMNSEIGLNSIQSFMYGSVIQQIEPHHLELLPIPILNENLMNSIHSDVMIYKDKLNSAILKELEAIDLIEKEIDQWQQ